MLAGPLTDSEQELRIAYNARAWGINPGAPKEDSSMKKTVKKMALNRETLVDLEQSLVKVAGGEYTARCQYSGYWTCGTCESVCTTNYC